MDVGALWDFDDPAGSEARLRAALTTADPGEAGVLQTQVARAMGLQGRYEEANALLDTIDLDDAAGDSEVAVRRLLETGRLLRSAGDRAGARPHFETAAARAEESGRDALAVDALHMVALVADADEQVTLTERALTLARGSREQEARDWAAPLLNNIGMTHADAQAWPAALAAFEEAVAERQRLGDAGRLGVAR